MGLSQPPYYHCKAINLSLLLLFLCALSTFKVQLVSVIPVSWCLGHAGHEPPVVKLRLNPVLGHLAQTSLPRTSSVLALQVLHSWKSHSPWQTKWLVAPTFCASSLEVKVAVLNNVTLAFEAGYPRP